MISLRDILARLTGGNQLPPVRPTSLYAAAATGTRPVPVPGVDRVANRVRTPDQAAPPPRTREFPVESMPTDVEPPVSREREFPEAPISTDVDVRPVRTQRSARPVGRARSRLLDELRSPAALRRAIVAREVLGPPLALQRHPDIESGEGV